MLELQVHQQEPTHRGVGISWPAGRLETPQSIDFSTRQQLIQSEHRQSIGKSARKPANEAKQWLRSSRGLLCSLGRCDDYYSPDTVGTWKFHRVPRSRYIQIIFDSKVAVGSGARVLLDVLYLGVLGE
ncbi:hypothetical protein QAD02_004469 [Eretmocerus hayati]|uniref:Uncharacterized protein n=1 Tax=Eretmocerus hayati TaxID=131215 RepID=A0ACC2NQ15_9HYME|nr:hypothetical protein QAD02_004469 [Eretmocerus hayati]